MAMATPASNKQAAASVEVTAKDLQGPGVVFCPSPIAGMKLWNTHPRIFLDVASTGAAKCAYCGTVYKLKEGEHFGGHH